MQVFTLQEFIIISPHHDDDEAATWTSFRGIWEILAGNCTNQATSPATD
jgi:hypothetical protein